VFRTGRHRSITVSPGLIRTHVEGLPRKGQAGNPRGVITEWSRASRRGLIKAFGIYDRGPMHALERAGGTPAMTTLTLSEHWLAVAPDAAAWWVLVGRFVDRYEKAWGPLYGVWKKEFQSRGAPHLHIHHIVPDGTRNVPGVGECDFRTWFAWNWVRAVWGDERDPMNPWNSAAGIAEERAKMLAVHLKPEAVNTVKGMQAAGDSRRLASYFLKHSAPGMESAKEYQNVCPKEWETAGRYWGVWRLDKCEETVEQDAEDSYRTARLVRRWSRSVTLRLPLGDVQNQPRVKRVQRLRGGRMRWTTVRAPYLAQPDRGGWISIPDAPKFATQLARYLDTCRADPVPAVLPGAVRHEWAVSEASQSLSLAQLRRRLAPQLRGLKVRRVSYDRARHRFVVDVHPLLGVGLAVTPPLPPPDCGELAAVRLPEWRRKRLDDRARMERIAALDAAATRAMQPPAAAVPAVPAATSVAIAAEWYSGVSKFLR